MSFAMIVYLIGMLDGIDFAIEGVFIFSGIALFVSAFTMVICHEDANSEYDSSYNRSAKRAYDAAVKAIKHSLLAMSAILILNIIIPSKETAYVMVAAYGVEGIVMDERVQQLGGKSLDVIEQWLDELAPQEQSE